MKLLRIFQFLVAFFELKMHNIIMILGEMTQFVETSYLFCFQNMNYGMKFEVKHFE